MGKHKKEKKEPEEASTSSQLQNGHEESGLGSPGMEFQTPGEPLSERKKKKKKRKREEDEAFESDTSLASTSLQSKRLKMELDTEGLTYGRSSSPSPVLRPSESPSPAEKEAQGPNTWDEGREALTGIPDSDLEVWMIRKPSSKFSSRGPLKCTCVRYGSDAAKSLFHLKRIDVKRFAPQSKLSGVLTIEPGQPERPAEPEDGEGHSESSSDITSALSDSSSVLSQLGDIRQYPQEPPEIIFLKQRFQPFGSAPTRTGRKKKKKKKSRDRDDEIKQEVEEIKQEVETPEPATTPQISDSTLGASGKNMDEIKREPVELSSEAFDPEEHSEPPESEGGSKKKKKKKKRKRARNSESQGSEH